MSLFIIEEVEPCDSLSTKEPSGCDLCGHCKMLQELFQKTHAQKLDDSPKHHLTFCEAREETVKSVN